MRKYLISILTIVLILYLVSGCSKDENTETTIFYGDTEKWTVIVDTYNTFHFIYKGDLEQLKNENPSNKINFFYGTSLGTTGAAQSLNNTNYYKQKFESDFITGLTLSHRDAFDGDKFINVQISYGNTTDSVDLAAYYKIKPSR
ncbi:MAG TPA: hypothetical protein VIK77_08440 [Tissierellaceae bacterium]